MNMCVCVCATEVSMCRLRLSTWLEDILNVACTLVSTSEQWEV